MYLRSLKRLFNNAGVIAFGLTASLSIASLAAAQVVPPLPKSSIEKSPDRISSFALGYGAGVANYMCYEALKGNLTKFDGNEILAKYKLWFENQNLYQYEQFKMGYSLEMANFNKTYPGNYCDFSL